MKRKGDNLKDFLIRNHFKEAELEQHSDKNRKSRK